MGRHVTMVLAIVLAVVAAQDPWLVVLGVAQDGGAPQAGCVLQCCTGTGARRHVASLGIVDPVSGERWIIDATPDFAQQLRTLDEIAPRPSGRGSPALAGILLTHAHIGHYTGLVHLGHEVIGARGVPVWAMPRMREFLSSNGPWDQLVNFGNMSLEPLAAGKPIRLNERLSVTPILVPHRDEYSETVGFRIDGPGRSALYLPDIDKWEHWDRSIEDLLAEVDVAWLDGTFYADGELSGRSMARIGHPFIVESMRRFSSLADTDRDKVHFIHLNHTNPALRPGSDAAAAIRRAGFHVAREGDRFVLAAAPPAARPVIRPETTTRPATTTRPTTRPAGRVATGFDREGSDPRAIEIADRVMTRLGGRRAWDETRYITWSFNGRRRHLWDKHTGRLRLERRGPRSGKMYVIIVDLDTGEGRAWRGGEPVTEPDELASMLKATRSNWINDAYWLVMPYKLTDAGVTLRDRGRGETADGMAADIVELTFHDVGDTPDNKYHVWVGRDSGLVEQWAFFGSAQDTEPAFVCPWRGWTRFGRIMLSGDRGELGGRPFELTDIDVFDELPDGRFERPEWIPRDMLTP